MPPAAIAHLISTGTIALDILAGQAGGPQADLDLPRIRWANSGLAIQVSDATLARPDTGGGPFRYDELSAAYRGVEIAVGILGGLECTFGIWRVSPIMRTRVKGLGWGDLRMAEMMDGVEEGMGVGVGG
ncbi:MAG: hypothetical protein LQ343_004848 [Gyalolechia ehrenbergii]|nr:MAG: hypothetical protein LQ343_004848 [Gyalolechia ehrenbergii]